MQHRNVYAPVQANISDITDMPQSDGRVIAVFEDDEAIADVIGEILVEETGCRVVVCTNAEQAEAIVQEHGPELIILDLVLPGTVDGMTALRKLKAHPSTRDVPVIVCTAATLKPEVCEELIRAGAVALLKKPFDIDDLIDLVRQHCARFVPAQQSTMIRAPI